MNYLNCFAFWAHMALGFPNDTESYDQLSPRNRHFFSHWGCARKLCNSLCTTSWWHHIKSSQQEMEVWKPAISLPLMSLSTDYVLGAIPTLIRHSQFSFEVILYCCNLVIDNQITTDFCTCHDSIAVVSCAKFCCDPLIRIWMRRKLKFPWNLNCGGEIVGEVGP